MIVIAFVVVVAALCELLVLLFLLVRPSLHHVAQSGDGPPKSTSCRSIAAKVVEQALVGEAVVEAVDHIGVGDVRNRSTSIEEAAHVRAE